MKVSQLELTDMKKLIKLTILVVLTLMFVILAIQVFSPVHNASTSEFCTRTCSSDVYPSQCFVACITRPSN